MPTLVSRRRAVRPLPASGVQHRDRQQRHRHPRSARDAGAQAGHGVVQLNQLGDGGVEAQAFDVLGDPVRRRILELLATGERSSGAITEIILNDAAKLQQEDWERAQRKAGKKPREPDDIEPPLYVPGDIPKTLELFREVGFRPDTPIEEGVRRFVERQDDKRTYWLRVGAATGLTAIALQGDSTALLGHVGLHPG